MQKHTFPHHIFMAPNQINKRQMYFNVLVWYICYAEFRLKENERNPMWIQRQTNAKLLIGNFQWEQNLIIFSFYWLKQKMHERWNVLCHTCFHWMFRWNNDRSSPIAMTIIFIVHKMQPVHLYLSVYDFPNENRILVKRIQNNDQLVWLC